jgi:cysteinylglycine-S-conjugate dipeptidase
VSDQPATLPAATRVPEGLEDVAATLAGQLPDTRAWLEELVRIRSISAQPEHAADCRRSAEATAELLRAAGLEDVRLLEVDGAHPYVTGAWLGAGPEAPTVLLYAHHDVQPVGSPDRWTSPPFEPVERDGRLYGRGAADDKAGVLAHVAAIRAWLTARGELPVNVKVIVEGEEEIGSPNLAAFLAAHGEELRADVIVLTDLTNWKVGWPGLTYALRGMADVTVTVRSLAQPVHSGMWGGAVPDALTGDDAAPRDPPRRARGPRRPRVRRRRPPAVGRRAGPARRARADPDEFRGRCGCSTGSGSSATTGTASSSGSGCSRPSRRSAWTSPRGAESSNTLLSEVRTKLSCRLAPGQDPERALEALRGPPAGHAPWGLHVDVEIGERNAAWVTEPGGPAWDAAVAAMTAAYGREPAAMGCGGSIPFVQPFSDAFGGAPCLLVGVEDPASNAHGEDESLHLEDFTKACLTEAFLLAELAATLRLAAGDVPVSVALVHGRARVGPSDVSADRRRGAGPRHRRRCSTLHARSAASHRLEASGSGHVEAGGRVRQLDRTARPRTPRAARARPAARPSDGDGCRPADGR